MNGEYKRTHNRVLILLQKIITKVLTYNITCVIIISEQRKTHKVKETEEQESALTHSGMKMKLI